jgi:mannan endo-1,6-alpha-mannosidase
MRAYKGVFGRTFARAALAAPFASDSINKILTNSAKAAGLACTAGQDPECSLSWDPDTDWNAFTATEGNIGEVYAALEMIQGLLYPTAKGLKSAKGAGGASGPANSAGNSTQSAGASGASGAGAPQNTGAAGSVAASMAAVLAAAAAAVLSC